MDEQRLKEFFTAIGTLAEMALLFYRSSIAAKATPEAGEARARTRRAHDESLHFFK